MRRIGMVIAMLAVGLTAGAVRAGVYALDDPPPRYPAPALAGSYEDVKLVLNSLRAAVNPIVPDQAAEGYKKLAAELEAKAPGDSTTLDRIKIAVCYFRLGRHDDGVGVLRDAERVLQQGDSNAYLLRLLIRQTELEAKAPGDLTTDDRINLGACYIRLGRSDKAVEVLKAADQKNFLVLANLAAAYGPAPLGLSELDRAVSYEEQALAAWPSSQPGWNGTALYWYHRAETYYLKLLRLRLREALANPTAKRWETLDALFDKPGSPAAPYEAHMQPWRMWGELPPDGYQIVAQLLVWSPNDDRLYWQLGELLNAGGVVQDAYKVFDELVNNRSESTVRELQEHRKILKASLDVVDAVDKLKADPAKFQTDFHTLMWAVSPRGLLLPPVGGDLANETAMAARAQVYAAQTQQQPQPTQPPPPSNPSPGWWPDWRPLFVGFAAGLIVATLAALQWTEWRRRRQAAAVPAGAPPPTPDLPPPQPTEPAVHDAGAIRSDVPTAPDRMEGAP